MWQLHLRRLIYLMTSEVNKRTFFTKSTLIIIPLLIICAFAFHYFFLKSDSVFSSTGDALSQFSFFTFLLQHAFKDGNLFWSWDYGLGGDLFGEFSYYYSTAPFFWLTLLLPKLNFDQIFEMKLYMSILKSTLAMLFMYGSLRYHNKTIFSSFISAIIYGGCVTFIRHSLLWDFMADAIVFLPLVIWGLDKYILERKKGLFLFATALMLASNFYFAFITSIFIYIYAFFQYFATQQNKTIKTFIIYYIRIAFLYALSLGLSAVCFIPSVNGVFSSDRLATKFTIPLFFEDTFYKNLMESIFFINNTEDYQLAFPVFILFLITSALLIRNKLVTNKLLFTGFMLVLYMLPYTYSVFNGFSAMQYRWFYLFAFVVAQTVAYILDWMLLHKKNVNSLIGPLLATALFIYAFYRKVNINAQPLQTIDKILICTTVLSIITILLWRYLSKVALQCFIVLNVLVNVIFINYFYSDFSLSKHFNQAGVTKESLHGPGLDNKDEIDAIRYIQNQDKDFYRIINPNNNYKNTPMLQGYHGTSTYQSLVNYHVHDFMKNKYNVFQGYDSPSMFFQLDKRLFLENMLGVKYYVLSEGANKTEIPYGYKHLQQVGPYNIYKNEFALPLGYVYEAGISDEEFSKLNFAEKDQLLLDAVVVNDVGSLPLKQFNTKQLDSKQIKINPNKMKWENIEKEKDILTVHENGRIIVPIDNNDMLGDLLVEIKIRNINKESFGVTVNDKSMIKGNEDGAYAYPLERFVYNLGKDAKPTELIISIPTPGQYELKDLQINSTNYQTVPKKVNTLKENSLQNIYYEGNSLKGEINSTKDGLLYLSVPYSKGWSIKVDGKETEFTKANSAFIGVPISKGQHVVEMKYVTPYFKMGLVISIISFIICISLLVLGDTKRYSKLKNRFKKSY